MAVQRTDSSHRYEWRVDVAHLTTTPLSEGLDIGLDVAVNDLFQFALAQLESIQRPADVHFTKEGSRVLGERVAEAILEVAGVAEWSTLQPSEAP